MPPFASVAESHRQGRRLMRRHRSNFYRAMWLLPQPKRDAMFALYAFARLTDDIGDCDAVGKDRLQTLAWWRKTTREALANWPCEIDTDLLPESFPIPIAESFRQMFPALHDSVQRFSIPIEHLLEIIDGVIASQQKTRFDTFEQLEHYCYLITSSIGMACLHIWGFHGPVPRSAVTDCGLAFQLTNYLRDITEDASSGHIYLPRQHYEQHGLIEDDLLAPRVDDRLTCLIHEEAIRASELFASGWQVWDSLDAEGRPIFSMMWRTYHELLNKILEDPAAILTRRIRVSRRKRLKILADHMLPGRFQRIPLPYGETDLRLPEQ